MHINTRYLGIDYGERRVGIAVSDEDKKYSFARDHLPNDIKFPDKLIAIIKEENISKIILGYPLNLNSEKTIQTSKIEEFRNLLEKLLEKHSWRAEIVYFDERFTSKIAKESLLNYGLNKKSRQDKGRLDSISAQIILQDYIEKTKNQNIYN